MSATPILATDIFMTDTYFQSMSTRVPSVAHPGLYSYARHPDGVRIRLRGHRAITLGGTTLDLSSLVQTFIAADPDTEFEYDAYLVHTGSAGRKGVLRALYGGGTLDRLTIRVIDIIQSSLTFHERYGILESKVGRPYRVGYYPLLDDVHLGFLRRSRRNHRIGVSAGLIVRRLDGLYQPGRRDHHELSVVALFKTQVGG